MPVNECVEFKHPGGRITAKCTAAVTGKRFVKISGNRTGGGAAGLSTDLANVYQVAPVAASTDIAVGVARYDAANGSLVGVFARGHGLILPITAGATITAGELVMADATGKVIPFVGPITTNAAALPDSPVPLGIAMTGAASDADAEILLF